MEEMHRCQQCPYEFELNFQLEHHVQRAHKNVYAAELFHAIVEPEQFSCICCKFKGYYNWDLYEHCKHKHHCRIDDDIERGSFCNEKFHKFLCDSCRSRFDSALFLVKHTDSHRLAALTTPPLGNAVDLAGNFPHTERLDTNPRPKRKYVMKKPRKKRLRTLLQCTKCSYETMVQGSLNSHMLQHAAAEDIVWLQCTKCSFKTKRSNSLRRHMLKHVAAQDTVWFQCTQCLFKTRQKDSMKRHMLKHAAVQDVAWFNCAECSFKTNRIGNLKAHMTCHKMKHAAAAADVVWFQCKSCSFITRYKSSLKGHNMLMHAAAQDIVWFGCANCPYKTKREYALKAHHTVKHAAPEDIVWVNCEKCSYKSKLKSYVKHHMNRKHPN